MSYTLLLLLYLIFLKKKYFFNTIGYISDSPSSFGYTDKLKPSLFYSYSIVFNAFKLTEKNSIFFE
jgi:hypothetical protein